MHTVLVHNGIAYRRRLTDDSSTIRKARHLSGWRRKSLSVCTWPGYSFKRLTEGHRQPGWCALRQPCREGAAAHCTSTFTSSTAAVKVTNNSQYMLSCPAPQHGCLQMPSATAPGPRSLSPHWQSFSCIRFKRYTLMHTSAINKTTAHNASQQQGAKDGGDLGRKRIAFESSPTAQKDMQWPLLLCIWDCSIDSRMGW